ncbi:amidohydrolase [Umezawaea sp. Da 62-37]|uniref:amidohydrolase n=1 Tax=Umezawaea sp. Da 62-37 TaxID=3075927 RepID=UPI0028F6D459|nr:amidohydrolase [Umezawaea sp. Da 62-37]WNV82851.1 amidohydrolase [Umezawaea sp. Da 62-37]
MILDLLLVRGRILTMDPERPVAASAGVWRGRVVGLDEEVDGFDAVRVVDLDGAVVLPGFLDAHTHLAWAGRASVTLDVSACRRVDEIVTLLRAATPTGGWLEVSGYDHRVLDRPLTAADLDRVSREHRVYVQDRSGHACVVNSHLLAELPAHVLAPGAPGVSFDDDGDPTGGLAESAQTAVRTLRLPYSVEEIAGHVALGARQCLEQGVTFAAEAGVGGGLIGTSPLEVAAYQRNRLPIRVQLMVSADLLHPVVGHADDRITRSVDLGLHTGFGGDRLSLGALKVFTDGGMMARTAALTEPYEGTANSGQLQDDPEHMRAAILDGHAAGWQLAVHAIGDRAVDFALESLEEAQRLRPRSDARHRVEHCGLVRPDQLDRIAALGVIPVVQPTFLWASGDDYATIMGPHRTPWMYRGKAFLDRGITIAGSSDRPVTEGAPLRAIQFMVERRSSGGAPVGLDEAITVDQALAAYTRDAAYACRVEDKLGTMAAGKLADFTILADDPHTVEVARINAIPVLATVVDGEFSHNPADF